MRLAPVVAIMIATLACSDSGQSVGSGTSTPVAVMPPDPGVPGQTTTAAPGAHSPGAHPSGQLGSATQRPHHGSPSGRDRRPIDVTLRSTPLGAEVAVDGTVVGTTPAFWNGHADGREHEFVFTLPGHAIARYRFVPVASGVLHARLEPIIVQRDAGVAPPPEVVPSPPPSAVVPPAQPPTRVPHPVAPSPAAAPASAAPHAAPPAHPAPAPVAPHAAPAAAPAPVAPHAAPAADPTPPTEPPAADAVPASEPQP